MNGEARPAAGCTNDPDQRLQGMTVSEDAALRDVLEAIGRGSAGVCLVCDDQHVFVGLLTDGDIRRALLSGVSIDSPALPFVTRAPHVAHPSEPRDNVIDTMRSLHLDALPIIDDAGRLVGVHALHELIRPRSLSNLAVVMAGGRGERLGELTAELPKPMLTVAGAPILERIVQKLVGGGITNIAISVNYKADVIMDHFGDGKWFGCQISYLQESPDTPLGTGGSLALLGDTGLMPTEPVIVMNGDVIVEAPFEKLLESHYSRGNAITATTTEYRHTIPFGVVEQSGGVLESLVEKPTHAWEVNAGVYVISPNVLPLVPRDTDFPIVELLRIAAQRGERVGTYRLPGPWIDIGRPAELRRARGEE